MSDQSKIIVPPTTVDNDVKLRVLIRGLKLDQPTRALIDAAIRSAVFREIAAIDTGVNHRIISPSDDPQTRSLLGDQLGKTLGLILNREVLD